MIFSLLTRFSFQLCNFRLLLWMYGICGGCLSGEDASVYIGWPCYGNNIKPLECTWTTLIHSVWMGHDNLYCRNVWVSVVAILYFGVGCSLTRLCRVNFEILHSNVNPSMFSCEVDLCTHCVRSYRVLQYHCFPCGCYLLCSPGASHRMVVAQLQGTVAVWIGLDIELVS